MIAEAAQHADHADIIRESLDGAKPMDNVGGDSGGPHKPLTYLTDKSQASRYLPRRPGARQEGYPKLSLKK